MGVLLGSLNTGVVAAPTTIQIVPVGNYFLSSMTFGVTFVINGTGVAQEVKINITRSNVANFVYIHDLLVAAGNTNNPQQAFSIPLNYVVPRGERILFDFVGFAGVNVIAVVNIYGDILP